MVVGLTTITELVDPVDQLYVIGTKAEAESVAELPGHTTAGFAEIIKLGPVSTVTIGVATSILVQDPLEPTTV